MASETETVTLRGIALLAGGVLPAVANWRKRDDFQPIDKEDVNPSSTAKTSSRGLPPTEKPSTQPTPTTRFSQPSQTSCAKPQTSTP